MLIYLYCIVLNKCAVDYNVLRTAYTVLYCTLVSVVTYSVLSCIVQYCTYPSVCTYSHRTIQLLLIPTASLSSALCVMLMSICSADCAAFSNARGSDQIPALPSGSTGHLLWQTALLMGHAGASWYVLVRYVECLHVLKD